MLSRKQFNKASLTIQLTVNAEGLCLVDLPTVIPNKQLATSSVPAFTAQTLTDVCSFTLREPICPEEPSTSGEDDSNDLGDAGRGPPTDQNTSSGRSQVMPLNTVGVPEAILVLQREPKCENVNSNALVHGLIVATGEEQLRAASQEAELSEEIFSFGENSSEYNPLYGENSRQSVDSASSKCRSKLGSSKTPSEESLTHSDANIERSEECFEFTSPEALSHTDEDLDNMEDCDKIFSPYSAPSVESFSEGPKNPTCLTILRDQLTPLHATVTHSEDAPGDNKSRNLSRSINFSEKEISPRSVGTYRNPQEASIASSSNDDESNKENTPPGATQNNSKNVHPKTCSHREDCHSASHYPNYGNGDCSLRPRRLTTLPRAPGLPDIHSLGEFPQLPRRPFSPAGIPITLVPSAWIEGPPPALWMSRENDELL